MNRGLIIGFISVTFAVVVIVVIAAIGINVAYRKGIHDGRREVYKDMFTAASLTASSKSASPQLREYVKAQMYFFLTQHNITMLSHQMPMIDLGPVEVSLIAGTYPFLPHADTPNDYYEQWK